MHGADPVAPPLRRVTLPNGLALWAPSEFEALMLYREIVSERTYEKHGIALSPGARVFDVGANIGMFAVHLAATVAGVRIRAFEPVATTFAILQRNLAERAPRAVAVHAGLAAADGTGLFTVDPYSLITASMTPAAFTGAAVTRAGVAEWVEAAVTDFARANPGRLSRVLSSGLRRWWARPAVLTLGALGGAMVSVRARLFGRQQRCALHTLSAELAASGFDTIDLVKIDVEGAEEEVLGGIAEPDWPRIRQLVIEVHDVNGRRARIAEALRRRGYQVTHDREDWALHALMGISTIYAVRR